MKLLATLPLLSLVLALPGPSLAPSGILSNKGPSLAPSGILSIKESGGPAQVGTGFISINDNKVVKEETPHKFNSEHGHVFMYRFGEVPNRLFMGLDEQKKLALTEQEQDDVRIIKELWGNVLSVGDNYTFQLCDDGLIGQNSGCTSLEDINIIWTSG